MYEKLSSASQKNGNLMLGLKPVGAECLAKMKKEFPSCPESYWAFLVEIGTGNLKEPDEPENFPAHFEFFKRLSSAEKEYYADRRIYEGGAKGDILIFGVESTGIAFGFDTGDDLKIVEVDNYRIVNQLNLSFEMFAIGLFVCYPDFPISYEDGKWKVATGEEYRYPA